jgi:hypothetical protein
MSDAAHFDTHGVLVRLIFGRPRPVVVFIRGAVEPKVWRFKNGIAVRDHSLTDALERVNQLANLKHRIGDEDDGIDEER